jgi:hypothetical protein
MAVLERVLQLYREKYFDFNLRHFHEKLGSEPRSGSAIAGGKACCRAPGWWRGDASVGCIANGTRGGRCPGMLHIGGSRHQWFEDERGYDWIVIFDDASSEIYYAQLVEEESRVTVMVGLREVIERKGVFCALYSDRGNYFWLTPKVGGKVDPHRLTQVGRALREVGIRMIPAYSPQARGRSERSFGTRQGRLPQELRLHKIGSLAHLRQCDNICRDRDLAFPLKVLSALRDTIQLPLSSKIVLTCSTMSNRAATSEFKRFSHAISDPLIKAHHAGGFGLALLTFGAILTLAAFFWNGPTVIRYIVLLVSALLTFFVLAYVYFKEFPRVRRARASVAGNKEMIDAI